MTAEFVIILMIVLLFGIGVGALVASAIWLHDWNIAKHEVSNRHFREIKPQIVGDDE